MPKIIVGESRHSPNIKLNHRLAPNMHGVQESYLRTEC